MNDETSRRSDDLNQLNSFMEAILASMRGGVVVLNTHFQVQVWNHRAEDLWGLRGSEVTGKSFFGLDIGLPVDHLMPCVRACLSPEGKFQEIVLDAVNRRGKSFNAVCPVPR